MQTPPLQSGGRQETIRDDGLRSLPGNRVRRRNEPLPRVRNSGADPGTQEPKKKSEPGAMPGRVQARLGFAPQVRTGPTSICTNRDRP
jgi:hypothetical protein